MENPFSLPLQQTIDQFLTRYETRRSAILPVLHAIQDEYQFISDEHIEALHQIYDLNRIHVREVITFYTVYRTEKPAKFSVLFCNNMSCMIMGSREAIGKVQERISRYESAGLESPFSVEPVACLAVCDGAPAMLVNKDRHLRVTASNVDEILERYAPLP